jgi:hypothetical protein
MAKKRKSSDALPLVTLTIYGIWSKEKKGIIFIGLDPEEVEMEYDMEGYTEDTHYVVSMPTYYDVNSLE